MKKTLIFALVFMLTVANSSVALADTSVGTGLTRDTAGGIAPIVKAKWEAYGATEQGTGTPYTVTEYWHDQATTAGAQFMPSGKFGVNTKIAICAIVTDPDGLADITTAPGAVYGDVFYPENVALGSSHAPLPGQSNLGCGKQMQEDKLTKLPKADGIALFCENVRNSNTNLPTFGFDPAQIKYTYDEICAADGELQKETAAVYCTTKDLSYEDPSGSYKVWAVAQDKVGLNGILENTFTYQAVTAFETDFDKIGYGPVKLATEKIISGDLNWDLVLNSGKASVRNVGNTRLAMRVQQDDMDFGQTDGAYNVSYKARVGSSASWATYTPSVLKTLVNELDLSELDEMDFSITISKFPPTHVGDIYEGDMTLSAISRPHLTCYTRYTSSTMSYGPTGWAGWSCPSGTHAVGGGVIENAYPMGPQGIAQPGATIGGSTYPVFPHYTFPAGETGYVAQNGGTGQTAKIYVDCAPNTP